ncbi:MAG TPA: cysteine--tRNA ligase [Candidatus Paceibacterota bacterium]
MALRIYDTLSGKKISFKAPSKKALRLFVCGPTVYDYAHIGHARTYIFFDIFTRYLKSLGYKVFYLQNITDIDDKIIARAREKNLPPQKLADDFTKSYLADMKVLGIASVTKYAPATKFIPQIIHQVKTLIEKGVAYKIEGDGYYFDISKFPDYGKLSRRTALQAEDAISRIDESIKKRNRGDFCLWKFSKPGEPSWKSDLGNGRPGWHIEDTAISEKFFGPQYEIHGGALDLKFPHHEAEIAQAEAASDKKPFVKIWMHGGLLTVNGEKMSKSLHNFITVREFLKTHPVNILRFIISSHHYRQPIDYTENMAESASAALKSLEEFLTKLEFVAKSQLQNPNNKSNLKSSAKGGSASGGQIQKYENAFNEAMDNDLNTPEAIAAIFNLINDVNKTIWQLGKKEAKTAENWLMAKLEILGIKIKLEKIPLKIKALAKQRELLRTNQQFIQADALRKEIEGLGYTVEDTVLGPLVLKRN